MFAQFRPLLCTALVMLLATPVLAASHREAPLITNDPAADITDFYFFRSWQNPDNAVLVTSWENLSIYYQDSSWRKQSIDNPKRSRVEDYNSRNEGYVIEQLEKIALTENVELVA